MVIDPTYYVDDYKELVDNRSSDIQKQMIADLEMSNVQWNIDNAWYDAHQSAGAKFQEYRDLGANPYAATRAALGSPAEYSNNVAPTLSGTGANSALTSAIGAVTQGLGAINEGVQTDLSRAQTRSNVALQDSQTANNVAQNPFIAPKAKAEIGDLEASAIEREAHSGALNAQQQKFISEANLNDTQASQIEQVMSRYDEVTDAQITMWQNEANLYFEEAITEHHKQTNLDADTMLKGAQADYYEAAAGEAESHAKWYDEDTGRIKSINDFVSLTGIPLDADNLSTLNYYEKKGDYVGAQRYLNCIFDCAANREGGVQSQSLPADRARYNADEGVKYFYNHPKNFREALFRGGWYHYPPLYNPSYNFGPTNHFNKSKSHSYRW